MKVTLREINTVNLLLALVILVVAGLIAYLLTGNNATPPAYSQKTLSLNIEPGFSVSSLNADLASIRKASGVEAIDQGYAQQGLNDSHYELTGPKNTLNEAARRLKLVNLTSGELHSTVVLSRADRQAFINQLDQLKLFLTSVTTKANAGISVTAESSLTSSYPAFAALLPRIELLKVADDQQVAEVLLNKTAPRVQAAIIAAASQGVNPTDMYADLTTLTSDAVAGQSISQRAENTLAASDLPISELKSINANLATAHRDILAAINAGDTLANLLAY